MQYFSQVYIKFNRWHNKRAKAELRKAFGRCEAYDKYLFDRNRVNDYLTETAIEKKLYFKVYYYIIKTLSFRLVVI